MKRTSAFRILMLCSLLLCVSVGTVKASEPGYTLTEYYELSAPTVDGKWTTVNEWADAPTLTVSPLAKFEYKMDSTSISGVYLMSWLVEFSDNTNDAGDRWQICLDGSNDGGTAPNANDLKIEIEGHTTLNVYIGTGTGWTAADAAIKAGVTWQDSITTGPHCAGNHYVLEVKFNKGVTTWGGSPPPHGLRVAMYDASNAAAGWQAWPPTTADNPSRWGLIADFLGGAYPEGVTIPVMLLVSSVAVLSASYFLRKRPKATNLTPAKL